MKQNKAVKIKHTRLAVDFNQLCEKDQECIENLTAQLAEIHQTAPETLSHSAAVTGRSENSAHAKHRASGVDGMAVPISTPKSAAENSG